MHVISGDLWAGAETMAFSLLCEIARRGQIDLHVALMNDGALATKLRDANIAFTVLDESRFSAYAVFKRLRQLVSEFRPQIVHTHRSKENVLGAIAARRAGARSLRTVHGLSEFPNLGLRFDKHLYRWLDIAAGRYLQQRVVAVSDDLKNKLFNYFNGECITVVENGIDLEATRRAALNTPSLPGSQSASRVGIIARLVPVKRHDRFVKAASLLLRRYPGQFEFYIVGDGPLADSVASQILNSGHALNIHQLGFRSDVMPVIGALNALVVASDHEGVPMNVLEAAALGIPVVSVPLPSIAEIIRSGVPGTVCEDDSIESIARGIAATVTSGKSKVSSLADDWRYSSKTMASKYCEIYAELATT